MSGWFRALLDEFAPYSSRLRLHSYLPVILEHWVDWGRGSPINGLRCAVIVTRPARLDVERFRASRRLVALQPITRKAGGAAQHEKGGDAGKNYRTSPAAAVTCGVMLPSSEAARINES